MQQPVQQTEVSTFLRGAENVRAAADIVVLAGSIGLSDGWTNGIPRALLPLPRKTIVSDIVDKLRSAFSGSCTVCVNGCADLYRSSFNSGPEDAAPIHFIEDKLPRGTAGCIKSSEPRLTGEDIFVIGGSVWLEDDPTWMLEEHRRQGNALTIYCIPQQVIASGGGGDTRLRPAGIFCCTPQVLNYIHAHGFQDVKEQLIPALTRDGLRVGAVSLKHQTHQVTDWATYLHAVTRALSSDRFQASGYNNLAPVVWCGDHSRIAEDARIVGPVLLGRGCTLNAESVVIGPAILGDRCEVGSGAWVVRCVMAPGSSVGEQVTISDYFSPVPVRIEDDGFGVSSTVTLTSQNSQTKFATEDGASPDGSARPVPAVAVGCVTILAAFTWAFWANVVQLWDVWQKNPDYSAGQLVPLGVLYMVGIKMRDLKGLRIGLAPVGLGMFGLGFLLNLFGVYYLYSSASNYGMVLAFIGLVTTMIGTAGVKKLWYPLAFLFLMLPLPGRLHDAVMLPLQEMSAALASSILEVFGVPVERFGNVLEVAGQRVAVAEACNGLRMAMAFLIVTGLVAYVIRRPTWQRVVVFLSSVPIALACNIIRIVVTASMYHAGHGWMAQGIFHDGAGLLMMPLALSMILLELWFLSTLYAPTLPRAAFARSAARTASSPAR